MKIFQFRKIRHQLIFWFLVLSILPLSISLFVTYNQRVGVIQTSTFDKLTAIRNLKASSLNNWLEERIGDVNSMSGDYEIRALENIFNTVSKSASDLGKINVAEELYIRNLRNYKVYTEIFYVDAKTGIIEISTNSKLIGSNISLNSSFRTPLETEDIFIQDIYYSQKNNKNEMSISTPVFCMAHGDHVIGILVAHIDLDNSLYPLLLDRTGLGETGETLIVNKDGVALNELRWYENAPLNLDITAEPVVRASNGETGITITKDYRGEDILAAYTYIPETKWGFVCKQDLKELNKPIREMMWNFLIIFIISVFAVSQIAILISRTITKPILSLSNTALKMRKGDLSVRNKITLIDEIGVLATEFNSLADSNEAKLNLQLGISEISKTMIGKSSMHTFSSSLLKHLMKITGADMSTFYILNDNTQAFECFSSIGANDKMLKTFTAQNAQGEFGNTLSVKGIFYLKDIPDNTIFTYNTIAGEAIPKEIITIPIIVDDVVVAIMSLVNIQKFSPESYNILKQSWTNINTSYSNLIATERTRILAEHLGFINEQLESQSEELQNQTEELQQQTEELQNQTEELHQTTDVLQAQNIELEEERKKVELATKLKSEFLANMSHELRTPLNSIMALSSVLIKKAKDKLDDEENDYLKIVERNGKRLLELINDILDLSKIEAGKMDVKPKSTAIDGLAKTLIENISTLSEQKGLTLTLNTQKNLPKVHTDESRLHQALLNIVANSVKFTHKGGVEIAINYDKTNVYIDVKDTGIGIAKDVLPHIFDEFRQADGTSSRQYEGTGLGLSIAKKMITILGGKIRVKSELGIGSVFTVTIPIEWHTAKA